MWCSGTFVPGFRPGSYGVTRMQAGISSKTILAAKEAETTEADSVEVSGFAGFVVGLALLPHVCYALLATFNIAVRGESFGVGPFGLELISCVVSLGLVFWSLGSFLQRGRGLPAGPLGLLGLSEGLSYLVALGLLIATAISGFRGGGVKMPEMPAQLKAAMPSAGSYNFKAPEFKAPDIKVPSFKMPEINVPDIKVPEFKMPDVKVPSFKMPDVKVPDFKMPDMPQVKVPEVKLPEIKAPEAPKPPPAPKVEAKKAEVKPAPAPKKDTSVDYDSLFD